MFKPENGHTGTDKTKEGDAGEEDPSSTETEPVLGAVSSEDLHRELRDGPMPAPAAMKGAGVALDKIVDRSLLEQFGGDPERDIHENIILSEN